MTDEPNALDYAPHDAEIERNLLGCILVNQSRLYDVSGFLQPDDFYIHSNRYVYEAILYLAMNNTPVDVVTVSERLSRMNKLDEIGGTAFLLQVCNITVGDYNAESYGKIIEEYSIRRAALEVSKKITKEAMDLKKPFSPAENAESLYRTARSKGRRTLNDNLSAWWDWYQSKLANPGKLSGLDTGIPGFNAVLDGLEKGTTTIVFGFPGLGKSILCNQIALNISRTHYVDIYSNEIDDRMIINRHISNLSGILTHHIKRGDLNEFDQSKVADAFARIEHEYHINIINDPGMSTASVRADIMRRRTQGEPVDMIVIDYIGLMQDPIRQGEDELDRQERVVKSIVKMTKDCEIATMAVHTLNKDNKIAGRMGILFACDNAIAMKRSDGFDDTPEGNRNVTLEALKIRDQNNSSGTFCKLVRKPLYPFFDDISEEK